MERTESVMQALKDICELAKFEQVDEKIQMVILHDKDLPEDSPRLKEIRDFYSEELDAVEMTFKPIDMKELKQLKSYALNHNWADYCDLVNELVDEESV